jgi:hypothetical protein
MHDIYKNQLDKGYVGRGNIQDAMYFNLGSCPKDIIPVHNSGFVELAAWEEQERILPDPEFIGQQLLVYINRGESSCLVKSTRPLNLSGNKTITLAGVGAFVQLVSIQVMTELRWRVVASDGAVLS